jgi:hypothetical protein
VVGEDEDIVVKLQRIQPDVPFDTSTITTEVIDNVAELPRGACSTGTLIPAEPSSPTAPSPSSSPLPYPTPQDNSRNCVDSELEFRMNRNKVRTCAWVGLNAQKRCRKKGIAKHCPFTCDSIMGSCGVCADSPRRFFLTTGKSKTCKWVKRINPDLRCKRDGVDTSCQATCGLCGTP